MVGRTWFHPEVAILLGRDRRNVNSLEQAAEILMSDRWPVHGRMCERAAVKLIQALEGEAAPDEARQAFRDAAEEAGILIGDDNRVPTPRILKRRR
jgi:hypothetical protein